MELVAVTGDLDVATLEIAVLCFIQRTDIARAPNTKPRRPIPSAENSGVMNPISTIWLRMSFLCCLGVGYRDVSSVVRSRSPWIFAAR